MPGLLIWSMNKFSVDANNSGDWVSRTFGGKRAPDISVKEWIFGPGGLAEAFTVGSWDKLLTYSTPLFQLAEGFCSLLVIQVTGQITRWLVNGPRSDSWMVCGQILRKVSTLITQLDCSSSFVGIGYLQLCLLLMEDHQLPRNWKYRRDAHRRNYDMRCLPLRMGHWKRKRERR